ncbi:MAG: response regulator [Deltaproteobacteria bacterium]|nr:response regulator [Deltaproteobacteria bacterium]
MQTNISPALPNGSLHVLVIDDDTTNLTLIDKTLSARGMNVSVTTSGKAGLLKISQSPPDVILLDVMMPEMNGFEVCRQLKSKESTRLIPVILITALQEREDKITGIEAGCDDFISKPIDRMELVARVQALGKVKRLNDDLVHAEDVIMSFARAVEAKDGTTGDHCDRLIQLSQEFGKHLGLDAASLLSLSRASVVHDVGKIGIPDHVLLKPGKLSDDEWKIMKQHPAIGEKICKPLHSLRDVLPLIRHHHERWNGTGYPDGLKGEAIPYLARIFQILDAYDAMTTVRPYKKAFATEEALKLLTEEAERGFWDPELVKKFIAFLK